jgi:hypothetical protein
MQDKLREQLRNVKAAKNIKNSDRHQRFKTEHAETTSSFYKPEETCQLRKLTGQSSS